MALFFISTTGVTVYKHYCSYTGVSYGVFMDVNHDCGPEEVIEEDHACCANKGGESDFQLTEECCTSDVAFYQIDTELINHELKVGFVGCYGPVTSFPLTVVFPKSNKVVIANKAPPALTTSKRLSLFQMYLI
jgi:hypothetical protein